MGGCGGSSGSCHLTQSTPKSSLVFANPLVVLFFRMRLRRDRNSSASRSRAVPSPFPLFLPRSTSQGLQALRRAAAPIDVGGSEGGRGGSLPMCSQGTKKPTLSGWVWCSCESRRQAMMTMISTRSVGRSVSRSRGSGHYFGAVAAFASSPCLESAYVSRRPFQVLSLGTPSRPAVTRQGSGCGLMLARCPPI